MKSQSLPISTIVIIVIAVVVLAAVLLFFFGAFGRPSNTVNTQNLITKCNTIAEEVQNSNPATTGDAGSLATQFGYCTQMPQYNNMRCSNVTHPQIETTQDGPCTLDCDGNTGKCIS